MTTPNFRFQFKKFQKQDLARAAMHDGLILSWDTGLWKTGAEYVWPLLKCGYELVDSGPGTRDFGQPIVPTKGPKRLAPKKPVLLVSPGDLHQQTAQEGVDKFNIATIPIASQDDFMRLAARSTSAQSRTTTNGIPVLDPGFYITSYSQLTTNGVNRVPDPMDWEDPIALMDSFGIKHGDHIQPIPSGVRWDERRPDFSTTCEFFSWRGAKWRDEYSRLSVAPEDTVKEIVKSYDREIRIASTIKDDELRDQEIGRLNEALGVLKNLSCNRPDPQFNWLSPEQQTFITRHFLQDKFSRYEQTVGAIREYHRDSEGTWRMTGMKTGAGEEFTRDSGEVPAGMQRLKIECVYSPSLADLCYESFECVCVDEGVKMKGEDTYVGQGVRKMNPKYRLVLTATPIKNRLPDIFRLAYWATGGQPEATARWPYRDDSEERNKFAETFMVSERNLTKEKKSEESGGRGAANGRYKRLTAEVCNIHRLWKLFGPIILRRRQDDYGEEIVPKIRRVIRAEMGTLQKKVYQYHLEAKYIDKNLKPAVGAQLQALRGAAAAPDSDHLVPQPGSPSERCPCSLKPVPPEVQLERLKKERHAVEGQLTGLKPDALVAKKKELDRLDTMIAKNAPAFDHQPPKKNCAQCNGKGSLPLPHRSGQGYIPKMASCLTLIEEILARKEQVVVFSAFTDPLDNLSRWLTESDVRHVKLDGNVSQKKRAVHASKFKRGRTLNHQPSTINSSPDDTAIPVMLAGVECMAEGHSFHLANNVILIAYSWAYDKFIQAINRVHRMNSQHPVNVYVIVCTGTIDLRLESLIQDKGDAAELVLDGRLIGERTEEVNLAELLKIAHKEFDPTSNTIDEAIIQAQWPALREKLRAAAKAWHPESSTHQPSTQIPINTPMNPRRNKATKIEPLKPASHEITAKPPMTQANRAEALAKAEPSTINSQPSTAANDWRAKLKARVAAIQGTQKFNNDPWRNL